MMLPKCVRHGYGRFDFYLATALGMFFLAGVVVAALVWRVVPTPVVHPNTTENDGSLAVAGLALLVPLAALIIWVKVRVRGLTLGAGLSLVGFLTATVAMR